MEALYIVIVLWLWGEFWHFVGVSKKLLPLLLIASGVMVGIIAGIYLEAILTGIVYGLASFGLMRVIRRITGRKCH